MPNWPVVTFLQLGWQQKEIATEFELRKINSFEMKPGSLSVKEDDKCVIIFQFATMGFETKRIKRCFDPEYWYLNGYIDQFVVPCPAFVKPHLRNPHIKYHLTTIYIFTRHFCPYAYIFKSLVTIFRNCTKNNKKFSWWRHQMETFSAQLSLCAGNSRVPVNSPHKGQWRGPLMFSLICVWINGWVNNREAGDLRRHRGHYDVIVMS